MNKKYYYKIAGLYFYSDWETKQKLIEKSKTYAEEEEEETTYAEALEIVADQMSIPCSYNHPERKRLKVVKNERS